MRGTGVVLPADASTARDSEDESMVATPDSTPRARVWIDGEEVTGDCFYADDDAGIVRCYKRNSNGEFYVVGTKPDPGWNPNWPEFRMYARLVSGAKVVIRPADVPEEYGEVAKYERRGKVRIELQEEYAEA